MLIDFFYLLRARGLPVGTTEYLTLLDALSKGLMQQSLDRLYVIGRGVLVKKVAHYDIWDQAFAEFFHDRPFTLSDLSELTDEVLNWLQDPKAVRELNEEEREALKQMRLDELRREFEERLREQKERHDGGSHWIGTGGTSPFGQQGEHPSGIRVGDQPNGNGRGGAVQVAMARNFRNLRDDIKLDIRQISVALRKLRQLTRDGRQDELDLDETIKQTARNAGDLEIMMRPPRKNDVKLLLLMDVGGSMTPYARLCSQLFSAAHQASHFKQFKSYYFHNCPYGMLFEDMSRRKMVPTEEALEQLDKTWRCMVVGDAAMAPDELMYSGGAIDLYEMNSRSGWSWLQEIKETVPRTAWLNPDPVRYWEYTYTTRRIGELFEMFPLTLEGLDEAVGYLRSKRHD